MAKKSAIIVGLGGHAINSWVRRLNDHPDWDLVGIVDTNTELLGHIEDITQGQVPEENAFTTITDYLNFCEKPDMAVIATPIPTHHVLVKEAMDNDLNVICEKNMTSTIYQARQMVELARKYPHLSTAMGTQRRYTIGSWTAKKYLAEESEIGDLSTIQWNDAFNWGLYRQGWRTWLQELFAEDQMIHWFDLMRWITGLDIVQVKGDCFIQKGTGWQGSSTVFANLALASPENYGDRHKWVWCRFYGDWKRMGPRDIMTDLREFNGSKGKMTIRGPFIETILYTNDEGSEWEEDGVMPDHNVCNLGTKYDAQMIILEQMSRSIESGGEKQPDNNFLDVYRSFAAVIGMIESSRTGKTIYVPDYWKNMDL